MPIGVRALILIAVAVASAAAQPKIGGIVNAASFASAPVDTNGNPAGNNVIAQGSIFTIFGTAIGPSSPATQASLPLQTTLGGTTVTITIGGQTLTAYPTFAFSTQVNAILPSTTPTGPATVTVTFNGQTSAPAPVTVAKSSTGVFSLTPGGPAIAQIARTASGVSLNQLTNPAYPGDVMILYATGLGAISGPDNAAPGVVNVGTTPTINIGGQTVQAQYAGRSPLFPGLDQINFQLPANIPLGCYTPAEVIISGQPSNSFVLSTAASGSSFCVHPLGLGKDALGRLDAGGTANIGTFQLLRAVVANLSIEGAGGIFLKANAAQVFNTYEKIPVAFGTVSYPAPLNSCVTYDTEEVPPPFMVPNFAQQIGGAELQAGASLSLTGPGGANQAVGRALDSTGAQSGGYLQVFLVTGGVFSAGNWALAGSGGTDVGPFNAALTLPANFEWTNATTFANVPNTDLTITWAGGNLNAQSVVYISGSSVVINTTDASKNRGANFVCAAPASAGIFVVPRAIRNALPSSSTAAGEISFGTLTVQTGGSTSFTAPLASGTLDAGYIGYGEARSAFVKYQ